MDSDLDIGFRIAKYTRDSRMIISFELAYFLKDILAQKIFMLDSKNLKGVWKNSNYPIIWYHDEEVASTYRNSLVPELSDVTYDDLDETKQAEYAQLVKEAIKAKYQSEIGISIKSNRDYVIPRDLNYIASKMKLEKKLAYFDNHFMKLRLKK